MTKRKTKPDPMKALRKKYPGKWRVKQFDVDPVMAMNKYYVQANDYIEICSTDDLHFARLICRMGNGGN